MIAEKGIAATVGKRCDIVKTGCRGLCANDVLVDIVDDKGCTTYDFVQPEEVAQIVEEHILKGELLEKRKAKPYYNQLNTHSAESVCPAAVTLMLSRWTPIW